MLLPKSKGHLLQNSLLLWGGQSCVLFRPSTDLTRPTHIMEGNLLYSAINTPQKHPDESLTTNKTTSCGQVEATHKINTNIIAKMKYLGKRRNECEARNWKLPQYTFLFFFFFFFFCLLGPHLRDTEVPRLAVELELQLLAYTTATAMWDLSHVCDLHHSSHQIL